MVSLKHNLQVNFAWSRVAVSWLCSAAHRQFAAAVSNCSTDQIHRIRALSVRQIHRRFSTPRTIHPVRLPYPVSSQSTNRFIVHARRLASPPEPSPTARCSLRASAAYRCNRRSAASAAASFPRPRLSAQTSSLPSSSPVLMRIKKPPRLTRNITPRT